jgi:hypothetical protein
LVKCAFQLGSKDKRQMDRILDVKTNLEDKIQNCIYLFNNLFILRSLNGAVLTIWVTK